MNANLKHAVPAAPLVEVDVSARWPVWTGASRAIDPPTTSTLPARLELGLALRSSRFHFSSSVALLTRDLLVSTTLRAKLHRGARSVVRIRSNALCSNRRAGREHRPVWFGKRALSAESSSSLLDRDNLSALSGSPERRIFPLSASAPHSGRRSGTRWPARCRTARRCPTSRRRSLSSWPGPAGSPPHSRQGACRRPFRVRGRP